MGYTADADRTVPELKELVKAFKETVKKILGKPFPEDPMEKL